MDSKKIFAALFFLLPGVAFAECSANMCSDIKIQEMQISTSGIVWIQTTGTEASLSSYCAADSGVFIKLDTTTNGGKNIYSALLATQAQNKDLAIRVTNMSPATLPCQVEYVVTK